MPELPEVETTRRGILPFIKDRMVTSVAIRNRQLRWPVPRGLQSRLLRQHVHDVDRRGKYLLFAFSQGCMILHLGMSGSLRIVRSGTAPQKHDHVDLEFDNGRCLRFRDPRRFGSIHWTRTDPLSHPLLINIGPEPLHATFHGEHLYKTSRHRKQSVKTFIMDSRVVAGVGNIYANEALFRSGIRPRVAAGRISQERYALLADAIREVLLEAIDAGGTTLRDFASGEDHPGYFYLKLRVYDRTGEPCVVCGSAIKHIVLGQRSSFYCSECQY